MADPQQEGLSSAVGSEQDRGRAGFEEEPRDFEQFAAGELDPHVPQLQRQHSGLDGFRSRH